MLLLGILIYLVLFTGLMIVLVKVAPLGYEDENGFHYDKAQKLSINNNNLGRKVGGIKKRAA